MNNIDIQTEDNFILKGTCFKPNEFKAAILIGPATGIKRSFYINFSKFLCENGYGVIIYDNRGIGDSTGENINQVGASLHNWGKLDMTAVLERLKVEFPEVPYHLIGHSAGGQLVGLMKNALELTSMFNYACSSGSIRNSKFPFILSSFFFLNIFIPVSNFLFGKTQSQWIGMGEPLPKKVSSDWRRWCNGKGYVKVDLGSKIKNHNYNKLSLPSLWLHASDDDIANLKNVEEMIKVFPRIKSKIKTIVPSQFGFKSIGHMQFFSSKKKSLWPLALEWLGHF